LQQELAHYQAQLQRISRALQDNDGDELFAIFNNAQAARQRWA
jgi:prephenate dehydrogenase